MAQDLKPEQIMKKRVIIRRLIEEADDKLDKLLKEKTKVDDEIENIHKTILSHYDAIDELFAKRYAQLHHQEKLFDERHALFLKIYHRDLVFVDEEPREKSCIATQNSSHPNHSQMAPLEDTNQLVSGHPSEIFNMNNGNEKSSCTNHSYVVDLANQISSYSSHSCHVYPPKRESTYPSNSFFPYAIDQTSNSSCPPCESYIDNYELLDPKLLYNMYVANKDLLEESQDYSDKNENSLDQIQPSVNCNFKEDIDDQLLNEVKENGDSITANIVNNSSPIEKQTKTTFMIDTNLFQTLSLCETNGTNPPLANDIMNEVSSNVENGSFVENQYSQATVNKDSIDDNQIMENKNSSRSKTFDIIAKKRMSW